MEHANDHPETAIFWKRAGDIVEPRVVILSPDDVCSRAVNVMCDASATAALIVDANNKIAGIITENDIVRKLIYRAS